MFRVKMVKETIYLLKHTSLSLCPHEDHLFGCIVAAFMTPTLNAVMTINKSADLQPKYDNRSELWRFPY